MGPLIKALVASVVVFLGVTVGLSAQWSPQPAAAWGYVAGLLAFLWGIGGFRAFWDSPACRRPQKGWRRYFNLQWIGGRIQYLVISLVDLS